MAAKQNAEIVQNVTFFNEMQAQIDNLTSRLQEARSNNDKQQEEMRIAFLRGVSALNQEAMGIFRKIESPKLAKAPLPNSQINSKPAQQNWMDSSTREYLTKSEKFGQELDGSIISTKGLVTRHYNPNKNS